MELVFAGSSKNSGRNEEKKKEKYGNCRAFCVTRKGNNLVQMFLRNLVSQQTNVCSPSAMETLGKDVKYIQN